MRCQGCDKNLNDWESTHKHPETGEYTDMCNKCLNIVQQSSIIDEHDYIEYQSVDSVDALDHVQERPSDFDYYEEDWDKYD